MDEKEFENNLMQITKNGDYLSLEKLINYFSKKASNAQELNLINERKKIAYNHFNTEGSKNNSYALTMLGVCFYLGWLGEKNYSQAIQYYKQAADQNNSWGQFRLGWCYYKGHGVVQSDEKAAFYFSSAAMRNDGEHYYTLAEYYTGYMSLHGMGVVKNYAEAIRWFSVASNRGHKWASYMLGIMNEYGYGTPINKQEAERYYTLALQRGAGHASRRLQKLRSIEPQQYLGPKDLYEFKNDDLTYEMKPNVKVVGFSGTVDTYGHANLSANESTDSYRVTVRYKGPMVALNDKVLAHGDLPIYWQSIDFIESARRQLNQNPALLGSSLKVYNYSMGACALMLILGIIGISNEKLTSMGLVFLPMSTIGLLVLCIARLCRKGSEVGKIAKFMGAQRMDEDMVKMFMEADTKIFPLIESMSKQPIVQNPAINLGLFSNPVISQDRKDNPQITLTIDQLNQLIQQQGMQGGIRIANAV